MNITNPLYITGISPDGKPLVGGVYRMKDQVGFPLDMSYEHLKEQSHLIDWLECACDCWLNDCLKFDALVHEASMLVPELKLDLLFKQAGAVFMTQFPEALKAENPVDEFCKHVLATKRK